MLVGDPWQFLWRNPTVSFFFMELADAFGRIASCLFSIAMLYGEFKD